MARAYSRLMAVIFSSLMAMVLAAGNVLANGSAPPKLALPSVPIILKAEDIDPIVNYPIAFMRLFRSAPDGKAVAIPFQIDEMNVYGDFVFNSNRPYDKANHIFDRLDELSLMSGDLGIRKTPTSWPQGNKPFRLYEVLTNRRGTHNTFYVAIYLKKTPPRTAQAYVQFNPTTSTIETANYRLSLNRRNYLAIEEVLFKLRDKSVSLIDWSSFYLKLDFKYFLTFEEDQDTIETKMSAWRAGPIRTVIRVDFVWKVLKLKLNPGFFTEMSFFADSLHLPALIYAPFDNSKILNHGSEMYYGFALVENPQAMRIETNMPSYRSTQGKQHHALLRYWLGVHAPDYAVLVNMHSNARLRANSFAPTLFTANLPAARLVQNKASLPPNKRINVAVYFDLTRFPKGEQRLGLQSIFVNHKQSPTATQPQARHIYVRDINGIKL